MSDLIDREALRDSLHNYFIPVEGERMVSQGVFNNILDAAPTIEPGRCGECKRYDVTTFCARWERCSHHDDFCSYFTAHDRKESDA